MSDAPAPAAAAPKPALPALPPPPTSVRGGFLRALGLAVAALAVTFAALHVTRVPRWIARLESADRWYRLRVLEWLSAVGEDARVTAAFTAQVGRMAEQARSGEIGYDFDYARCLELLSVELEKRKPAATPELLDAVLTIYSAVDDPTIQDRREAIAAACLRIVGALGPEAKEMVRARVAAITDPKARFGALLLACAIGAGRPEDVPAILEAVEAESPAPTEEEIIREALSENEASAIDREFAPSSRHEAARRAVLGLGKDAVAPLIAGFESRSRAVAHLCASALAELDLPALVPVVEKRIDEAQEQAPYLEIAYQILARDAYLKANPGEAERLRSEGQGDAIPSDEHAAKAREILGIAHHLGYLVAEGLQCFVPIRNDERVDLCFMRALSAHNQAVAKFCARELEKRLDRDRFVDTLFKFLAHKPSFDMKEVDVYEGVLRGYGAAASPAITRNLDALAATAGHPSAVFWIHKAIGLRCLADVGDASAYDTLARFAVDAGGYTYVETKTSPVTGQAETTETPVLFRDLCVQAAAAIEGRTGTKAPELPEAERAPEEGGDGGGD